MLVFSTGILIYTGLFQSREAAFLLTTPASTDRIFAYKFSEAIAFSSWGFLLLGSPMMVAYGIMVDASASFYAIFLAYQLGFVLLAGAWGPSAAILIANFLPEAAQDDPGDRRGRPRGAGRRRGPADAAGPPAMRSRATG